MRRVIHPGTPRSSIGSRFLLVLLAAVLVLGSGWAYNIVGTSPETTSSALTVVGDTGVNASTPKWGTLTLVVGTDSRTDAQGQTLSKPEQKALHTVSSQQGLATDTMMVIHTPPDGGRSTIISLPRDTWIDDDIVHAPGVVGAYSDGTTGPFKANKLNSFYGSAKYYHQEFLRAEGYSDQAEIERLSNEAGREILISVVQTLIGLQIDHYAEMSMLGFYLLSQAIGGVEVCLIDDVKDHHSGADFPAGHFEVSGVDALAFVRQRHGLPRGDLDRIARQRAFLVGSQQKIMSWELATRPNRISEMVAAADRGLVLDSGSSLLDFGQNMIKISGATAAIPQEGNIDTAAGSALAVNNGKVRSFFADIVAPPADDTPLIPTEFDVAPATITVDIFNGTMRTGMAAAVGRKMASADYQRGQLADYPGTTDDSQQKSTTVRYPPGAQAAAEQIVATLGMGKITVDDTVSAGHITVVIGTDMPRDLADAAAYTTLDKNERDTRESVPEIDVGKAGNTGCIH